MRNSLFWPLLFFTLTVVDMISTYYVTPDLKHEGNPIVNRYNLGWISFLGFMLFTNIFWISLYLFHQFIFNYKNRTKTNNLHEYVYLYFLNQNKSFIFKELKADGITVIESLIYACTNFLGYFWIRVLCYTKLYAIVDNFLVGFFLKNFVRTRQDAHRTEYRLTDPSLMDLPGLDFIIWYAHEQAVIKENWFPIFNTAMMVLIVLFFLRHEYKRINNFLTIN
ncbi:hypothetical protein [Arundinibacter roseus]|nr:hypothetical protein [Arundinibacter roseus]